jgi:hypothetical protein
MQIGLIAHELTGTNLAECDARAVVGVDVGCDFEDETSELGFLTGSTMRSSAFGGTGLGAIFTKQLSSSLHAEVVQSGEPKNTGATRPCDSPLTSKSG